ncbi:MAG: potassium transporter Kup [Gemmatimonadetes bacterium 13_2_20CM_69_27]|nr:MAG: potassium transporter Kup [Gemmatimonadetes bacterium 13_2_20CM_69_27]OLB60178.1 MAG: potassium transporter Kup [Gemmatimonadetes bacterium 13_2_20CM_2_69_23]OLD60504.1 MAG: potassium transporter Kup [Gemmatimonadetes bacterium 13_1_20CM_69_28]PYO33320.1 MAG: potassium transporter Kup [Gemmatimonadota bacterium]PYP23380.1 MAG: potassium transporter Kup [Gemmatimonadota bacterium]
MTPRSEPPAGPRGRYLFTLALAALGVVYGDIGTSPLYAIRESFYGTHGIGVTPGNVLGVMSMVFWSLVIVVTIKYHIVIIRADNKGEGGVLALMALVNGSRLARGLSPRRIMIVLGIFGSALLYADGALTPAISVLSAVEGLEVATPELASWVLPVTLVILVGLFLLQSRGTARIGAMFGPVMLVWFATLGVLGLSEIIRQPGVLAAVSPYYAVRFFGENAGRGFVVLGAVFLVVTGGEALYADLGHFGHRAIQRAWFGIALPSLMLNYFGQGALLLRDPAGAVNPFYHLAPSWALYPLIALATVAAIIASQAVISGAFSLTRQAVQLGYSPRLRIEHTSSREIGQIYVPAVNWGLMLLTCVLVLGFRTSSNIAGAYGVALSTLMLMTTLMFYVMSREVWGWSFPRAAGVAGLFLWVDLLFFAANMLKIRYGGWVPLAIAAAIFLLMTTWKRGREILGKRMLEKTVPLKMLLADLAAEPPLRVPGTAVFMYGTADHTPPALVHNLAHNKVLHEKVVFLTVVTEDVPHVEPRERVTVKHIGKGFHTVVARYGFMDDPDLEDVLEACRVKALDIRMEGTTFFLGRETLVSSDRPGMDHWRATLFAFMSRNALRATAFFKIPANQVFEVGAQVEL